MEFRMLGPLEVTERGRPIALGGPRQRAVLAHLLVHANRIVPTEHLIDAVWDDDPPEAARNAVQSYVSRLRSVLGDEAIEGRPPGYVLRIEERALDSLRFETLVARARRLRERDTRGALAALAEALALWRGPALADLANNRALGPVIARLEDGRLTAAELRLELLLELGRHEESVAELERLVVEHPLRERFWRDLMLALYRSGRQADALEAFQRGYRALTELGIEPSSEVRELQAAILRHDPALELRGTPLRGYRVLEKLGEGAYGVVHRAEQVDLGREVAIKVIRPELADDPRFITRFEAEARLVARIEHPHVVPLYDYWREPGAAYLVMRWLRGGSLRHMLRERAPLDVPLASRIVEQAASGLAAAHGQGVVHRDVKPENILLDEDGNAFVSDFGIAVDADLIGSLPSSPESAAYTSPEVRSGHPPTPRTDVYLLGVALQESLTGTVAENQDGEGRIPARVASVIRRARATDPDDRFADAGEFAEALRAAVGDVKVPVVATGNPYKGLRAFEEPDAGDFFGREALVERLVGRLSEPGPAGRFVAVVGASGSGKSSVVKAGLLPRLRAGALPGSDRWFVISLAPGAFPLEELESALLRVAVNPPPTLIEQLERDELGLMRAVKRSLPSDDTELLVVIDQLEEVFTLLHDAERRSQFLAALAVVVNDPHSRTRIVTTLRADFYDRPLEYPRLAELVRSGTETVTPLTSDELERAIVMPARQACLEVEPALVAVIAAEAEGQAGALPLIQYALTELAEQPDTGGLTVERYRAIGGLTGAVARRADTLFEGLDDESRHAARQVFLRLVALDDEAEGTRRRVPLTELTALPQSAGSVTRVIDVYGSHRLLTFDRDARTRTPTIEIAHEALLREWGTLRTWIEEATDDVRLRARLTAAMSEWEASGRDPGFLLRGSRLEVFETWATGGRTELTRAERAYVDASLAAREEERAEERARLERERAIEERSARRLRLLVFVLAVAAVVAAGLGLFALNRRDAARAEAERAEAEARVATSRELSAAALANLEEDPERAILLALQAVEATAEQNEGVTREAEEALHLAVAATRVVAAAGPELWEEAVGRPLRTEAPGSTLAVANGRHAEADEKGVVVRDADGNDLLRVPGDAIAAAFSPDGQLLAVSAIGLQEIWDIRSRARLHSLVHQGHVRSLEFSPDGARLVTGGDDGSAHVWEVESGRALLQLPGLGSGVARVAFASDGERVAAASDGGHVLVWDISPAGSREVATIATGALGVSFDSTGTRIATASEEEGAFVWDARTGSRSVAIPHSEDVFDVAFAPDGTLLASAAGDGVVRLFDTRTGRLVQALRGHTARAWGVAFTPDGTRLASGAEDARAILWDVATGRRLTEFTGHGDRIYDVAVSPDGRWIASTGEDGLPRIWEVETGRVVSTLPGHSGVVVQVDFSPDGSTIATAGFDGSARLYDPTTGEQLLGLDGHSALVLDVAFSPDGERVATASADGTTRIWDAVTGTEQLSLTTPSRAGAGRLAFSPDGTRLAIGGLDDRVRIVLLDPHELVELARRRVTRQLTDDECLRYLHRPSCEAEANQPDG